MRIARGVGRTPHGRVVKSSLRMYSCQMRRGGGAVRRWIIRDESPRRPTRCGQVGKGGWKGEGEGEEEKARNTGQKSSGHHDQLTLLITYWVLSITLGR